MKVSESHNKDTKTLCVPQKIPNRKVPQAILNKFDLSSNTQEFLPRKCLLHVRENIKMNKLTVGFCSS